MRSRSRGCTIQVHLWNGDPHGIRVVSRAGWDGYLLVIPSSEADIARELDEELNRISTVVMLGPAENGRLRVRLTHASPAVAQLGAFASDQLWTHMFVLGRESDFPQVFARQVALRLIQAARRHGQVEVVETYPTPPKPVRAAVRDEVDAFTREAMVFLALCGVTIFDTTIEREPSASQGPSCTTTNAPIIGSGRHGRSGSASADTRPPPARPSQARSNQMTEKAYYDEDMHLLLELGLLKGGQLLQLPQPRKGVTHQATVEPDGALRFQNRRYPSPSGAAVAATGSSSNGWIAWHTTDGRPLDFLRKTARKSKGKS
ncbi:MULTISPECIES: DUF4357 domain-containing protein [Rhodococcus]